MSNQSPSQKNSGGIWIVVAGLIVFAIWKVNHNERQRAAELRRLSDQGVQILGEAVSGLMQPVPAQPPPVSEVPVLIVPQESGRTYYYDRNGNSVGYSEKK